MEHDTTMNDTTVAYDTVAPYLQKNQLKLSSK